MTQKHKKIFDFIHRKCAVQPLEQKNLDCIFSVFPHLYVYTRLHTACLYIQATLHILKSLFRQFFLSFLLLRVYMNPCSMFPSLNVVTAGLNRMQVSCNISLYERYTGWPECQWTDISVFMLFVFYERHIATLEVYSFNN